MKLQRNLLKLSLLIICTLSAYTKESKRSFTQAFNLNLNKGNSDLQTYGLETKYKRENEKNTFTFFANYNYGKADNETTLENWITNAKYERSLSKRLSGFVKQEFLSDLIAGINYQSNTDLGIKLFTVKSDKKKISFDFGYRLNLENRKFSEKTNSFNKGVVKVAYMSEVSKAGEIEAYAEYLPNFTNSDDYQINSGASFKTRVLESFSLRNNIQYRFDNDPAKDAKKEDMTLFLSFVFDM